MARGSIFGQSPEVIEAILREEQARHSDNLAARSRPGLFFGLQAGGAVAGALDRQFGGGGRSTDPRIAHAQRLQQVKERVLAQGVSVQDGDAFLEALSEELLSEGLIDEYLAVAEQGKQWQQQEIENAKKSAETQAIEAELGAGSQLENLTPEQRRFIASSRKNKEMANALAVGSAIVTDELTRAGKRIGQEELLQRQVQAGIEVFRQTQIAPSTTTNSETGATVTSSASVGGAARQAARRAALSGIEQTPVDDLPAQGPRKSPSRETRRELASGPQADPRVIDEDQNVASVVPPTEPAPVTQARPFGTRAPAENVAESSAPAGRLSQMSSNENLIVYPSTAPVAPSRNRKERRDGVRDARKIATMLRKHNARGNELAAAIVRNGTLSRGWLGNAINQIKRQGGDNWVQAALQGVVSLVPTEQFYTAEQLAAMADLEQAHTRYAMDRKNLNELGALTGADWYLQLKEVPSPTSAKAEAIGPSRYLNLLANNYKSMLDDAKNAADEYGEQIDVGPIHPALRLMMDPPNVSPETRQRTVEALGAVSEDDARFSQVLDQAARTWTRESGVRIGGTELAILLGVGAYAAPGTYRDAVVSNLESGAEFISEQVDSARRSIQARRQSTQRTPEARAPTGTRRILRRNDAR